jgi:hypothetical protein
VAYPLAFDHEITPNGERVDIQTGPNRKGARKRARHDGAAQDDPTPSGQIP